MEFAYRLMPRTASAVALLVLTACQSGSGGGIAGVNTTAPPPPSDKITQSELIAYCPAITIREGTASYDVYAKGGDQDRSKIVYQAAIDTSSRSCKRADGQMAITAAVAGRVVPGPLASAGSVTLPIRVALTVNGAVASSTLYKQQVSVSDTSAATQFTFKAPDIVIPTPADGTAHIYIGFDDGPGNKPPPEPADASATDG